MEGGKRNSRKMKFI